MGKRIEDLKETAPCGMLIHYTVNEEDMITYNDINGRGVHCDKCDGCTWKGICKPEEPKKAMSHKTYIEIYNLIDDAMQEAGEKVEEACNKLAKSDAEPKCVLACNMVEQIKKYQKLCKYYSAEDMTKIIEAAMKFVSYHTTYCNSMNAWIKGAQTAEEIEAIQYGAQIPDKYKSKVLKDYEAAMGA